MDGGAAAIVRPDCGRAFGGARGRSQAVAAAASGTAGRSGWVKLGAASASGMPRSILLSVLAVAALAAPPGLAAPATISAPATGPTAPARPGPQTAAVMPRPQTIAFGAHGLQQLDFYPAATRFTGPRPLIVFVHGGAWAGGDKNGSTGSAKIRHYTEAGYALASVNYRLLPEVDIEDQAADLTAAIGKLRAEAKARNLDPSRIVLMGHSAGAHLAALVATDPQWLGAVAMKPADIAGVVLLDGPAYDVPTQIRDVGPLVGFGFQIAFGSGAARQKALSPASHVGGGDARRFLLLHVDRPDATNQAVLLDGKLRKAGVDSQVLAFPGTGMEAHNLLNAMLGRSNSPATKPVDAWLAETFAKTR